MTSETANRTSYVVFRCREAERIAVGRAAAVLGETVSGFARRAVLQAVRQVGTDLIDVEWLQLPDPEDDEDAEPWQNGIEDDE